MIAILSVCLNDEQKLPLFLANMATWSCRDYQFYLIDNGSTDQSLQMVAASGQATKIIRLGRNQGTTGGYNEGIRQALAAGAEYIMFLALDVTLAPDAIQRLAALMDASPEFGVLAPCLYYSHDVERVNVMGLKLHPVDWHWENVYGEHVGPLDCGRVLEFDYVDGGTSMFRSEALKRVGLLDEMLFMYAEDQDICLRLNDAGYRVGAAPEASAWHRHMELSHGMMYSRPYEVFYCQRNSVYLMRKHAKRACPGAYWRALARALISQPAYYLVRRHSPRLAFICLEGLFHGLCGWMGKTKYVK